MARPLLMKQGKNSLATLAVGWPTSLSWLQNKWGLHLSVLLCLQWCWPAEV